MKSDPLSRLLVRAETHLKAGRLTQAKLGYQQILAEFPKSTEAHFQMAILLHDERDPEGAVRHFERLLHLSPNLAEVQFNLGTLLAQLGRKQEAAERFRKAIALQPTMADAHNNLGVALRDLGEAELAIESFESAIHHAPKLFSALVNLGTTLIKCRRPDRAVEVCRLACELQPDVADTHLALGLALELAGQQDEAVRCLQEAVRRKPESAEWRFHFAASTGCGNPTAAPAEYVASLFDAYAEKFDEHLCGSLHYQTPEHILSAVLKVAPARCFDILDLGCGTGLCGVLFQSIATRIVGIDLSGEMIRIATSRNIYNELQVNDISGYMRGRNSEFNLILAADVFVYVGDLSETFQLASAILRPGGLFAFSVEAAEDLLNDAPQVDRYRLTPSRRYVHTLDYVRQLAAEHGFLERSAERTTLRTQAGADVRGWIVVLEEQERALNFPIQGSI